MDIGLEMEVDKSLPMPEDLRTSALWIAVNPGRREPFDSFLYVQMKDKGSVYAGDLLLSAKLLAKWPYEIYIGWQNPGTAIWVGCILYQQAYNVCISFLVAGSMLFTTLDLDFCTSWHILLPFLPRYRNFSSATLHSVTGICICFLSRISDIL